MNTPPQPIENKPLQVRRGRVESVDLYEVKDSELDILEKGSPATIQLNFAVFLLSIAFSSILALCTATFKWDIAKTLFAFVAVVGILMGAYLLLSWCRTRTSIATTIKAIRTRIETSVTEDKEHMDAAAASPKPAAGHDPAG